MFKKLNKKGFTLAELLVVVAISGVLVAISIPIFTSQLEKAREATDMANIRAAYAEVVADGLTDPTHTYSTTVSLKQAKSSWETKGNIAGVDLDSISITGPVTITYHPTSGSSDAYVTIGSATVPATSVSHN